MDWRRMMAFALSAGLAGCASGTTSVGGVSVTTTGDGRALFGTYERGDASDATPVLMLLHDPRGDHDRHDFDRVWHGTTELGWSVLAVDVSGFGESTDAAPADAATDPAWWPADLLRWRSWMWRRVNEDQEPIDPTRIAVIGLGASGSVAAAAVRGGFARCGAAVGASAAEIDALLPGFDDDVGLHDLYWAAGSEDQPAAADLPALLDATAGARDSRFVSGDLPGWDAWEASAPLREDAVLWCTDKL